MTDTTLPFLVGAGAGSGSGRSKHSGNVMLKKPDKTGCAMGHKKLKARLKKLNSEDKSCASAEPIDASTTKTTTRKRRGMNIMVRLDLEFGASDGYDFTEKWIYERR